MGKLSWAIGDLETIKSRLEDEDYSGINDDFDYAIETILEHITESSNPEIVKDIVGKLKEIKQKIHNYDFYDNMIDDMQDIIDKFEKAT